MSNNSSGERRSLYQRCKIEDLGFTNSICKATRTEQPNCLFSMVASIEPKHANSLTKDFVARFLRIDGTHRGYETVLRAFALPPKKIMCQPNKSMLPVQM